MKRWIAWALTLVLILGWVPVEVFAEEAAAITDITLNRTKAELLNGWELTLEASIQPADVSVDKLTWTSSDSSVAKLEVSDIEDSCIVKAVGEGTAEITVEAGGHSASCSVTVTTRLTGQKTITVPTGAEAQLFFKKEYYSYTEIEPVYEMDNGDGTATFYFSTLKSDLSWRVTKAGMTTKAGYWDRDPLVITADSEPEQKNGSVNENSILLNGNSRNCLNLDVGDTYDLWAFRTWEIVDSFTGNHVIMPDFTYDIYGQGVVTLEDNPAPMNGSSCQKTLKAIANGTAIIEVSYNAIDIFGGSLDGSYSACDDSRKGLLIVQVGDAADVAFNIDCFSSLSEPKITEVEEIVVDGEEQKIVKGYIPYQSAKKKAWDAEFDTLYFKGDSGTLKFSPTSTTGTITEVSVSNNNGGSYQPLKSDEGTYTATIVPGNNILRAKIGTDYAYQVVRGDRISARIAEAPDVTDKDKNVIEEKSDGDERIEAGEFVRVYLDGLHQPFPKLAGIYNPGFSDGPTQHGVVHLNYSQGDTHVFGPGAQYDFITAANYVEIQFPENSKESVILKDGYIGAGVFGRDYADGDDILTDKGHRCGEEAAFHEHAIQSYHTRSILPQIEIKLGAQAVNQKPSVSDKAVGKVTLTVGINYPIPNLNTWFTDPEGDSLGFWVSVDGGDETEIQGSSYSYTASKEGTVKLVFRAFDGKNFSDPHTLEITVTKADSGNSGNGGSNTDTDEDSDTEQDKDNDSDNNSGTGSNSGNGSNVTPGGTSSDKKEYGLAVSEIAGYVTISFEDKGVRLESEKASISYPNPLGTIISATKVPFKIGDTIADVTLRLLDEKGIGYDYNTNKGFYLEAIKEFVANNSYYASLGELDAGKGSGWMITWNDWFIDHGASAFQVKEGDVIRWQYTCQLGADIGDPYYGENSDGLQNGTQDNTTETAKTVSDVEKLIKALPDTITKAHEAQVKEASDAYEALTADQKAQVDKALVEKLDQAKKTIGQLTTTDTQKEEAREVEKLIDAIGSTVTLDSEDAIRKARQAYDKLTDGQKYLVGNYEKLTAAEQALELLKNPVTVEKAYQSTGDYLEKLGTPNVGTVGGEWMVIGLVRAGREVPDSEQYYQHVLKYIQENVNEKHQLHRAKSTDNSRLILAMTAIGKDPTNVGGENLLLGLTDMEYVGYQGINGPIWALLAFDSGNYPVPEGEVSREKLIDAILEAQLADGGWALSGDQNDADMTGMALQALAPYYAQKNQVKEAVDKALAALQQMQREDGSFASIDGPSAESIAQVIAAMAALKIDADTDARFMKNGISAMDALLTYYIPGGGFCHVQHGNLDGMATEQAYYALVAYNRMKENKTSLYDMTDVVDMGGDRIAEENTEPMEVPTEPVEKKENSGRTAFIWTSVMTLCTGICIAILLNRKKLFGKFL